MINRLFTTSSCVGTPRAIVCVARLLEIGCAQWRSSHLVEVQAHIEVEGLQRVDATQEL